MSRATSPSRTAERAVAAALDAFGTRGYGATSLDDLARDLGVRKQTILYWYPSKEALLDAAIDRVAAEVSRRLRRPGCWARSPRSSTARRRSCPQRWTPAASAATTHG